MTRDQEFYAALSRLNREVYMPGENKRLYDKDISPLKNRMARENKIVESLEKAVELTGLQDGMTISFHHHFRDGDHIVNMVLDTLARMGFRDNAGRDATQAVFARILASGRLLLGIINDILDYSKIEAGKLRIEAIPIEPARVTGDALLLKASRGVRIETVLEALKKES